MADSTAQLEFPKIDQGILEQIDKIQLSQRLKTEREEFFKRDVEITGDRAVLAVENWQETQGDVLDIRFAKMVQKWAERLPIVIFKDQLVVGSETKLFRGADPWVEGESTSMSEVMEGGRKLRTSAARVAKCDEEDWEALEEAVHFFFEKASGDVIFKATKSIYGDWPEDFEKARGVLRQGRINVRSPVPRWEILFGKGLKGIIQDAEAGLARIRSGQEPDARKGWFWQAAIMCCNAVIHLAHRYAKLARELAQAESNPTRQRELQQIAEVCERVPEYPVRTLHEAVQSRLFWALVMKWCRPDLGVPDTGRVDQFLYPYFIADIREQRLSVDEAGDLIGGMLSTLSRRDGVKNRQRGENAQGTLVNNATLGGVTEDGQDADNELTYLVLHMVGLLKYAEPHYTFRVNAGTPKWALLKALHTNRMVGGGQPQFMSDDRVIGHLVAQGERLEDARDWMGHG